jgi:hypothetical protein
MWQKNIIGKNYIYILQWFFKRTVVKYIFNNGFLNEQLLHVYIDFGIHRIYFNDVFFIKNYYHYHKKETETVIQSLLTLGSLIPVTVL